ncbi:MAG TPA: lytic transglycosylase [Methanosarcinales archaeon]|nr:lytic transglycosylase [Methanosarcinales archaeon]
MNKLVLAGRLSIIVILAFWIAAACNFYVKLNITRLKTNQQTEIQGNLESEVKELKSTIERVLSTSNKIDQARPQLVEWVYTHSRISRKMAEEIVDNVKESSCPIFLLALMKTESNFNPTAVSSKGAMGLGQIMPLHKKALTEAGILNEMRDIFDISTSIKATEFVWQLKMAEAGGDINRALVLYLGGHDGGYENRILKDYFLLNYLCTKPLMDQKAELVPTQDKISAGKNSEPGKTEKSKSKKIEKSVINNEGGDLVYIVKSGDYLSKIIQEAYGITNLVIMNAILDRNPSIGNPDIIEINQRITLPVVKIGNVKLIPNVERMQLFTE